MLTFPDNWKERNTLLGHDWLTGMRGGERVLEILCEGNPSAPVFTLIYNSDAISDTISRHPITTSCLQSIPGIQNNYRNFLPLFPSAIEKMRLPEADILITTSHCVAKGLKKAPGTKHVCYCFTPMRYAWTFYEEYFGNNPVKAMFVKPLLAAMRRWDKKASSRVDKFIAISRHVQKRIKEFYGRDSDIVYPPVNTQRLTPGAESRIATSEQFDLIVSALVPYKRVDLAVKAYSRLGFPLKIAGTGSMFNNLRANAGPNITFLGWQSDDQLLELYRACRALVFPGEEDFGIVPLEAQACGRPVIAYRKGGALETVEEDLSGVFFDEQTEESLIEAAQKCSSKKWNSQAIRIHAEKFSEQKFIDAFGKSVNSCLDEADRTLP